MMMGAEGESLRVHQCVNGRHEDDGAQGLYRHVTVRNLKHHLVR